MTSAIFLDVRIDASHSFTVTPSAVHIEQTHHIKLRHCLPFGDLNCHNIVDVIYVPRALKKQCSRVARRIADQRQLKRRRGGAEIGEFGDVSSKVFRKALRSSSNSSRSVSPSEMRAKPRERTTASLAPHACHLSHDTNFRHQKLRTVAPF